MPLILMTERKCARCPKRTREGLRHLVQNPAGVLVSARQQGLDGGSVLDFAVGDEILARVLRVVGAGVWRQALDELEHFPVRLLHRFPHGYQSSQPSPTADCGSQLSYGAAAAAAAGAVHRTWPRSGHALPLLHPLHLPPLAVLLSFSGEFSPRYVVFLKP
jgi:hypothetical protein